jgi:hypothetical protein
VGGGQRASTPLGAWAFAPSAAHARAAVKAQKQDFKRILDSGLPLRRELVDEAIRRRGVDAHAYFRGSADLRTADLARAMPPERYAGKAGFVLASGDCHVFQPKTFLHGSRGLVAGIVDTDRAGFAPYEWDLRSLLVSIELQGRAMRMPAGKRSVAMKAALEAYQEAVGSVAKRPRLEAERAAKRLRDEVSEDGPLGEVVSRGAKVERGAWLARVVDTTVSPPRLVRVPRKVLDIPDVPAGGRQRILDGVRDALPAYLRSLPREGREALRGYQVTDVAIPVSGNGSMGYGRYQALLVPPGNNPRLEDMVILEFKEELPSAISCHVDQGRAGALPGDSEAGRMLNLFRLGAGAKAAPMWGTTTMPAGTYVASASFLVTDVRHDKQEVEIEHPEDLARVAAAQGRLLAAFQCLGAVNAKSPDVGGAKDILADIRTRPDFQGENLRGARSYADVVVADAKAFREKLSSAS